MTSNPPDGLYSYSGTVVGLKLEMERMRERGAYKLSRFAFALEREYWPVSAVQELTPSHAL